LVIIIGITVLVFIGKIILRFIGSNTPLDIYLLAAMGLYLLLEANYSICTMYIAIGNKLPFVSSCVVSTAIYMVIALILLQFTRMGFWAIILANLVALMIYRGWKWPAVCLKALNLPVSQLIHIGTANIWNMLKYFLGFFNKKISFDSKR
jgi:hypothetical protein